ncbi:MAG: hypothetical protein OXJ64_13350, partial [Boseongicola sp.]|nr:hypothetical protein [Boseongicola sp.]
AVFFHVDPSRSAKVAMKLLEGVKGTVVLVCDRYRYHEPCGDRPLRMIRTAGIVGHLHMAARGS